MKPGVCLLVLLLLCCKGYAQQRAFKQYSVRDGLAHSVVYRVMQSRDGFLWLGTANGVSRFDGRIFNNYLLPGAATQEIMGLCEDSSGTIWVAYLDGRLAYIREDSAEHRTLIREYKKGKLPPTLVSLWIDRTQRSWMIDKDGRLYSLYKDRLTDYTFSAGVIVHTVTYLNHTLVACTSKGIIELKEKQDFASYISYPSTGPVYCAVQDKQGTIWLGGKGLIYAIEPGNKTRYIHIGTHEPVNLMLADYKDRIWFSGVSTPLSYLDHDMPQPVQVGASGTREVFNAFTEQEGNIWLASYGNGLFCLPSTGITNYLPGNNLPNGYINYIYGDTGRVWIATMGRLQVLENQQIRTVPFSFTSSDEQVRFILNLPGRQFLVGTSYGIYRTDQHFKTLWYNRFGGLSAIPYGSGFIAGSYSGLYRYDHLGYHSWDIPAVNRRRIFSIVQDKLKRLWLATDSGIFYQREKAFVHMGTAQGLAHLYVSRLCTDRSGNLWAATRGGLSCITPLVQPVCTSYTMEQGLPDNHCHTVAADPVEGVWVATYRGLCYFNGQLFTHITEEDGLVSNEVLRLWIDPKRNLWVGTVQGISCINLNRLRQHKTSPLAYISSIYANGNTLNSVQTAHLDPGRHNLRITLGAIELSNPSSVTFAYRLGHETDWTYTSNTQIEYSALAPGSYTFIFKCRNNNSSWSMPVHWKFDIAAPLWEQTWFIILVISALLCAGVSLSWWRIRDVHQTAQEKLDLYTQMQLLKQQNLSAHLNPHFIFNSLNSIQHFLNVYDKRSANEYLGSFAQLIRRTMDDSAHTLVPLSQELERLQLYLKIEQLRFGEKLKYFMEVDPQLDTGDIFVPCMIMQPYVENAIWHGLLPRENGGTVWVKVRLEQDMLELIIEDDGVGFGSRPSINGHQSKGRRIMEERFELLSRVMNRTLQVHTVERCGPDGKPCGTRVCLQLPADLDAGIL